MTRSLLALRRLIRFESRSQSVVDTRETFQLHATLEPSLLFAEKCDRFILSVLVFLILFSPLAYGSVDPWAYDLIRVGVLVILSAFLMRAAYTRDFHFSAPLFTTSRFAISGAFDHSDTSNPDLAAGTCFLHPL